MHRSSSLISGTVEVNGAHLYYEEKGRGHPLILLHAGIADSRMWDDQFEIFSRAYRVIRFDLRGFGRSSMPPGSFSNYEDVRGLMDSLKVEEAYLLGNSFGGLIALDFTLAYPSYAKALVLVAPSVSGTKPSERIKHFWEQEDLALESGDYEEATQLNLKLWVDGPHRTKEQVNSDVRDRVREMQSAIFKKDIPDETEEIGLDPPALGRLGEVGVPVLAMIGELDLEEKLNLAEILERELIDCRKVTIPGAAHMLSMEKVEEFNRNVLDFLSRI